MLDLAWQPAADGSLVLDRLDLDAAPDDPAEWRASLPNELDDPAVLAFCLDLDRPALQPAG